MKNIYIIQNSQLSFDMDISQLHSVDKITLFLIANEFSLEKLNKRNQAHYFKKIYPTENFSFSTLMEIIEENKQESTVPFNIVTNSEESVLVCGELRKFFNLDKCNYDRFINKVLMKKLIQKSGTNIPKHIIFNLTNYIESPDHVLENITDILKFPLIAKPIDSCNCMNVEKIYSADALKKWCDKNKLVNVTFEVDEFIEGKVYNCDSYIKNNKILFTQVSECSNSCFDFICGFTKGTIALPHDDPMYQFFSNYTKKVHEAVGMPTAGVTHLEVILTSENNAYFVEIAHRSPGMLIPAMYKKFLNIGTIEPHILLQIDDEYELPIQKGPYCAWVAFPRIKGRLIQKFVPIIESEYQLEWMYEIGDLMDPVFKGRDCAGRVLLWNDDYQQLRKDFYYLNTFQFFDVKNDA